MIYFHFFIIIFIKRERERENLMKARGEKKIIIIIYKTVIIMDIG